MSKFAWFLLDVLGRGCFGCWPCDSIILVEAQIVSKVKCKKCRNLWVLSWHWPSAAKVSVQVKSSVAQSEQIEVCLCQHLGLKTWGKKDVLWSWSSGPDPVDPVSTFMSTLLTATERKFFIHSRRSARWPGLIWRSGCSTLPAPTGKSKSWK